MGAGTVVVTDQELEDPSLLKTRMDNELTLFINLVVVEIKEKLKSLFDSETNNKFSFFDWDVIHKVESSGFLAGNHVVEITPCLNIEFSYTFPIYHANAINNDAETFAIKEILSIVDEFKKRLANKKSIFTEEVIYIQENLKRINIWKEMRNA